MGKVRCVNGRSRAQSFHHQHPLDTPAADGGPLPASHPITQLVQEAAWLVSHLPLAA